jgi:hypothetical protein
MIYISSNEVVTNGQQQKLNIHKRFGKNGSFYPPYLVRFLDIGLHLAANLGKSTPDLGKITATGSQSVPCRLKEIL